VSDHFLAGCEGAGTLSCSDLGAYIHNATCSIEVEVVIVMNSLVSFATKDEGFAVWGVVTPTYNFAPIDCEANNK
jgi:hypothetical protein